MSPKQPPHQSITLATARRLKSLFNPPKRVRSRKKLGPIKTRLQFEAVHREIADIIESYTTSRRPNYKQLMPWVARDMHAGSARYLNANNLTARVSFAEGIVRHLLAEPALQVEPLHFVTLVSREYVVSIETALTTPESELQSLIYSLQQLTRQALQGISFIGMVEPALWKDWTVDGPRLGHDSVHWHVHVIVWGSTRRAIARATREVRRRHRNIYGGNSVHCKTIGLDELALYGRYMAKAPLKEYRLHENKGRKSTGRPVRFSSASGFAG